MTEVDDQTRIARRESWTPYICEIAGLMGLSHWTMSVSHRPPEEGNIASVGMTRGRYYATIYLSDRFLDDDSPGEQRDTVVHELIHCQLAAVDRLAQDNIPSRLLGTFDNLVEYAIDLMAKSWSQLLPLPADKKG